MQYNLPILSSVTRNQEASTNQMLMGLEVEYHRRRRREAQRNRRANQDDRERDLRREVDRNARNTARSLLSDEDRVQIRHTNTAAHASSRRAENSLHTEHWWDHVAQLNLSQVPASLGLHWNRVCKHCSVKASASHLFVSFLTEPARC